MSVLSEIFVQIRGDASQMSRDMEAAHGKGMMSADRMEKHFMSKVGRMVGVYEGLRLGATSLSAAMKQIEAAELIEPGKGKQSLAALLAIHEAERDIIREIPLIGGLGAQLAALASGDKDIKKTMGALEEVGGGESALETAKSRREALQLKAFQSSGAPAEQVAQMAAQFEDKKLATQQMAELRKAADAEALYKSQMDEAQRLRAHPAAQRMNSIEGFEAGSANRAMRTLVLALTNPGSSVVGANKLKEAETREAAAHDANVQAIAHRRAAKELGQARDYAAMAGAGVSTASGGALPNVVPQSAQAEYLLGQILDRLNSGVRLTP